MKRLLTLIYFLCIVGGGAFAQCPTTLASDSFVRAACASSCGAGGGAGPNYTITQGAWTITSNSLGATAAPGSSNPIYYSAQALPPAQCAGYRSGAAWTTVGQKAGPAIYIQAGAKSGVYVYCSVLTSTNCSTFVLAGVVADVVTTLQTITTYTAGGSLSIAPYTEITIRGNGSGTVQVYAGASQIGSNQTYTTWESGWGGFMTYNNPLYLASYFEVGNLTAPTATQPTFSPVAGTYPNTQTVSIAAASGPVICYNITGSPATNGTTGCTTGTLYAGPVTVSSNETLYASAGGTGYANSTVGSAVYAFQAATPNFSPVAGTYGAAQTVTIADATSGATCSYCSDSANTCAPGTSYSTPVVVTLGSYLRSQCSVSGYAASAVASGLYATTGSVVPTSYSVIAP